MTPRIRVILLASLLAAASGLAGCGSSQKVTVSGTTTISTGKQLEDLQRALAAQAITQAEYEMLRKKILDK